jgi:regulator of replication initiation timing
MSQHPKFTLDEIGEYWGRILSQAFANIIALEKQIAELETYNASLSKEADRLRHELHKAQVDLVEAQTSPIINQAKEKAAG